MILALFILWILPGIDLMIRNEWYQYIPEFWRRAVTILFEIGFAPIGVVLNLFREFGKLFNN